MRTVQRAADGGIAARTAWLNGLLRASGTRRRRLSETGSGMRQVGETEGGSFVTKVQHMLVCAERADDSANKGGTAGVLLLSL